MSSKDDPIKIWVPFGAMSAIMIGDAAWVGSRRPIPREADDYRREISAILIPFVYNAKGYKLWEKSSIEVILRPSVTKRPRNSDPHYAYNIKHWSQIVAVIHR